MVKISNQTGAANLFETIGVLAIVATLTIGGFSLYSSAIAKAKRVMINDIPREKYREDIVFGPYKMEQLFPDDSNNTHIFLGEKCLNDFSCRRSFCGQIEIVSENEVYVRLKNLTHCIKNMATY